MFGGGGGGAFTPIMADGWIPLAPSSDSNIIYVSSSGQDPPTGLGTFASPIKKITDALNNKTIGTLGVGIRDGKPDWIVFKSGDRWSNEQFLGPNTNISGRSAAEPMVVSNYDPTNGALAKGTGGARPLFTSGSLACFELEGGAGPLNFWTFDGLELYASTRDPNSPDFIGSAGDIGFTWFESSDGLVLQDMFIHYFTTNFSAGNPSFNWKLTNTIINRCIFADAYNVGGHSEGFIIDNHFNTKIFGCLNDHNGWNENTTLFNAGADAAVFNQGFYIQVVETAPDNPAQTSGPTIMKGNIVTNAAACGIQLRTGGTLYDNFISHNPIAMDVRMNGSSVSENVITQGYDIQQNAGNGGPQGRGWGLEISYAVSQHNVQNNIFAHCISTDAARRAIDLSASTVALTNANPTAVSVPNEDEIGQTNMQMMLKTAGGGLSAWSKYYAVGIVLAGGPGNGSAGTTQIATTPNGTPIASSAAFSSDLVPYPVNATGNIIYQWKTGAGMAGNVLDDGSDGNGNTMSPNDIDGSGYPFPTRDAASYDSTLGGPGTLTHFLSLARGQRKANWDDRYTANAVNNHIKPGFGRSPLPPSLVS